MHDFEKQKSETLWVWNDLNSRKELPSIIKLDLHFIPKSAQADWELCRKVLQKAGFHIEFYDDGSTLEASIESIDNTCEQIWFHEERATKLALSHGFIPDGWGFMS